MSKKKNVSGKKPEQTQKTVKRIPVLPALVILLLAALITLLLLPRNTAEQPGSETTCPPVATETAAAETLPPVTLPEEPAVNLGYGLYATHIAGYTGMYMEDGSDEILADILMMVVQNRGEQDIQYAEITMDMDGETAHFILTTLPVGESVVLLEQNRMAWSADVDYSAFLPRVEAIAYFQEPISTLEDQLEVSIVDGAINVTNISGQDIPGTITVYYKNAAEDIYYGGITYRVRVEGGLKAGEIRQIMTQHAHDTGSKILLVTVTP